MIQCELCKSMIQKAENMRAMTDGKHWHYPSCPSEEAKVVTCVFKKEYIHHVGDTIEVSVKDYKNLRNNGYVELKKLETVLEGMTKEAKEKGAKRGHTIYEYRGLTKISYMCTKCRKVLSLDEFEKEACVEAEEAKEDKVDHPSHYNQGGIECIDALAAATANLKGIEAFDTANAIKYLWRWKEKNGVEDLEKAIWYINHMIDRLKS